MLRRAHGAQQREVWRLAERDRGGASGGSGSHIRRAVAIRRLGHRLGHRLGGGFGGAYESSRRRGERLERRAEVTLGRVEVDARREQPRTRRYVNVLQPTQRVLLGARSRTHTGAPLGSREHPHELVLGGGGTPHAAALHGGRRTMPEQRRAHLAKQRRRACLATGRAFARRVQQPAARALVDSQARPPQRLEERRAAPMVPSRHAAEQQRPPDGRRQAGWATRAAAAAAGSGGANVAAGAAFAQPRELEQAERAERLIDGMRGEHARARRGERVVAERPPWRWRQGGDKRLDNDERRGGVDEREEHRQRVAARRETAHLERLEQQQW